MNVRNDEGSSCERGPFFLLGGWSSTDCTSSTGAIARRTSMRTTVDTGRPRACKQSDHDEHQSDRVDNDERRDLP